MDKEKKISNTVKIIMRQIERFNKDGRLPRFYDVRPVNAPYLRQPIDLPDYEELGVDPEGITTARDILAHLYKRLSLPQREVLDLMLQEYTEREIADITKRSRGSVQHHIRKIRNAFTTLAE